MASTSLPSAISSAVSFLDITFAWIFFVSSDIDKGFVVEFSAGGHGGSGGDAACDLGGDGDGGGLGD